MDDERQAVYSHTLCQKTWLFIYNNSDMPFFTSDNPVLMQNFIPDSIDNTDTGIGRPDTLIFFPLSSRIMIEMVPEWLLRQEQVNNTLTLINNADYKFIITVNTLQCLHATKEILLSPSYENGFSVFWKSINEV